MAEANERSHKEGGRKKKAKRILFRFKNNLFFHGIDYQREIIVNCSVLEIPEEGEAEREPTKNPNENTFFKCYKESHTRRRGGEIEKTNARETKSSYIFVD